MGTIVLQNYCLRRMMLLQFTAQIQQHIIITCIIFCSTVTVRSTLNYVAWVIKPRYYFYQGFNTYYLNQGVLPLVFRLGRFPQLLWLEVYFYFLLILLKRSKPLFFCYGGLTPHQFLDGVKSLCILFKRLKPPLFQCYLFILFMGFNTQYQCPPFCSATLL